jgi:hypothetical protein
MTGDKAVELINEWLNLAKEVGEGSSGGFFLN